MRGYATGAERHAKIVRLQVLRARLAGVQRRMGAGSVPVVRGGKALLRKRGNLAAAGLTQAQWRVQWEAGQPHPRRKTATARRTRPPDQAAQDRPGPPASQDYLLLAQ